MNSLTRKIIVATVVGLFFGGSAAVGGAIQFPDLPAVAHVGLLLSGFALGAMLGFAADWMVTSERFRKGIDEFLGCAGTLFLFLVALIVVTRTPAAIWGYFTGTPNSKTGEVPTFLTVVFLSILSIIIILGVLAWIFQQIDEARGRHKGTEKNIEEMDENINEEK